MCGTGGDFADPDYNTISGSSMAGPHISGIVAQLLQVDPTLTPAEIEDVLEETAYKFAAGADYEPDLASRNDDDTTSYDKGHGLVDVVAAIESLLGLSPSAPSEPSPPESVDPGEADLTLASGESGEVSGSLQGFTGNYQCSGPGDEFCPTSVIAVEPDGATTSLPVPTSWWSSPSSVSRPPPGG